jgi:hypothetical protein
MLADGSQVKVDELVAPIAHLFVDLIPDMLRQIEEGHRGRKLQ